MALAEKLNTLCGQYEEAKAQLLKAQASEAYFQKFRSDLVRWRADAPISAYPAFFIFTQIDLWGAKKQRKQLSKTFSEVAEEALIAMLNLAREVSSDNEKTIDPKELTSGDMQYVKAALLKHLASDDEALRQFVGELIDPIIDYLTPVADELRGEDLLSQWAAWSADLSQIQKVYDQARLRHARLSNAGWLKQPVDFIASQWKLNAAERDVAQMQKDSAQVAEIIADSLFLLSLKEGAEKKAEVDEIYAATESMRFFLSAYVELDTLREKLDECITYFTQTLTFPDNPPMSDKERGIINTLLEGIQDLPWPDEMQEAITGVKNGLRHLLEKENGKGALLFEVAGTFQMLSNDLCEEIGGLMFYRSTMERLCEELVSNYKSLRQDYLEETLLDDPDDSIYAMFAQLRGNVGALKGRTAVERGLFDHFEDNQPSVE